MKEDDTRVAELTRQLEELQRDIASRPPPAEFTEYRGAFFKRSVGDEYVMAVYCPSCLFPAAPLGTGLFNCRRCSITLDIGSSALSEVIYNHVIHVKRTPVE